MKSGELDALIGTAGVKRPCRAGSRTVDASDERANRRLRYSYVTGIWSRTTDTTDHRTETA